MKIYELENNNKFILKTGNVEEQQGDIVICWSALNFQNGSPSFYKLHKKSGPQLFSSTLLFHYKLQMGDCISTIPGLLDFNLVIHSVLPDNINLFNNSWFNIIRTIETYKKDNIARDLFFDCPIDDYKLFLDNFLLYAKSLQDFSFNFICNEEDYKTLLLLLDKRLRKNFFKRILKSLNAFPKRNQEKLSKNFKRTK